MADRYLMQLAAQCYQEANEHADAARCFVEAGEQQRALDIYLKQQMYAPAADVYRQIGPVDHAGWLLADRIGDVPAARAIVEEHGDLTEVEGFGADGLDEQIAVVRREKERYLDLQDFEGAAHQRDLEKQLLNRRKEMPQRLGVSLRWRLVQARCDAAEQVAARRGLKVLLDVQRALAGVTTLDTQPVEEWAVSVATAMRRHDQAALVFAASVRGLRDNAIRRWRQWSTQTLGEELVLPPGIQEGAAR